MIENQEDKTFNVIKYGLSRFLPIRVVLRKDENGKFQGLTEESFSMGLDDYRVRIWWSGKAYSILGEHIINGINDAEGNSKEGDIIFDPLSADCPIEIDWQKWTTATTKYYQRNAPFNVKKELK